MSDLNHNATYYTILSESFISDQKLNKVINCESLYFTIENDIIYYLKEGTIVSEIIIPKDANAYYEDEDYIYWVTDKYIIKNYFHISKWNGWNNDAICIKATNIDDYSIKYIPERLYLEVLKKNGYALRWIPFEKITKDLCMVAIENNTYALQWILEELKTYDLCLNLVTINGDVLRWVPNEHKDNKIYEAAVKSAGYILWHISFNAITPKICELAVKNDERALQFVPDNLKTRELCLLAATNDYNIFKFIPKQHIEYVNN